MEDNLNQKNEEDRFDENLIGSRKEITGTSDAKWVDNNDNEVTQVFGFNENAELVNSRAAMIGFIMLILTELIFNGKPVTLSIFGIN
ncbi:putative high light inducible protein [Prochlorococcus sp. SS52]|nr:MULTISPECIES: high light inducible protein [Prochlorococcus]KGG14320.1 putative high light inducible protein [Prochlorococcus marinus str. LG]KGG22106.1 putative high light inducible protein [Prochlorococcus marinus str. SS2]KGG24576.1 putative high light inducible protein [Prochlorococcus marinus str. SS35]KGG33469.1 putative high light inducible protein [Prochlorococcus marinus str. SS51]KGG37387.1 putative high light inducible protein [Prochlorococcus sp. SS52]